MVRCFHPNPGLLARVAMAAFVAAAPLAAGCSRGRPQAEAATLPQVPPIEFAGQWGMQGHEPGQLDHPVGPAVDSAGRVYLADRGTGFVEKFAASGTALLTFEDAAVRGAAAIAVDRGGGIYVANVRAGEIRVFFPEGDLLRVIRVSPQNNFAGAYGFSAGADGRLFVPDPAGGKIQVLSPQGRLEKIWRVAAPPEAPGAQPRPFSAMAGPDGFLYVADAGTGRIVKFSSSGEQLAAWKGAPTDAARLLAIAVSPKYVFALLDASPRLKIWTLDGQPRVSDDLGGLLDGADGAPSPLDAGSRNPVIPNDRVTSHDRVIAEDGAPLETASLAIDPRGELVILNPAGNPGGPRVLRFRIHLDSAGGPLQ